MRAKAERRRRPIRPRVKLFILSPIYEFFTETSSPKPIFSSTDRNKDQKKRIYAPRRFRILRQALPNAVSDGNPEAKPGMIQPVSDDFRGHFVIRRIPESGIFRFLIKNTNIFYTKQSDHLRISIFLLNFDKKIFFRNDSGMHDPKHEPPLPADFRRRFRPGSGAKAERDGSGHAAHLPEIVPDPPESVSTIRASRSASPASAPTQNQPNA